MIESCWNRRHDNLAVFGIPPLVRVEISQPSQQQGPVVAAHQFLADPDELVEEALAFCDRTDEEPFVHIAINQKTVNMLVCNCHWCCCELILPLLRQDRYPLWKGLAKSRFEAAVHLEKCKGCGKCRERCQFGAVALREDPVSGLKKSLVDAEKCMGCGCCAVTCPAEAREMKLVRPPEHIPDVGPVVY